MPTFAARRTLLASRSDVWGFLAEPHNLGDWWPGITVVRPDRRGLAPGGRWEIVGPDRPSYFRRPQLHGTLLVLEVDPLERIAFQLTGDRIDAELRLRTVEADRTEVELTVSGPWLIGLSRSYAQRALGRLYSLLQTAADA
ncbi:MAG: SRPBCC domain-containing protein [Gaiellaceae bacterium]